MRARNLKPGLFKNELLAVADPLYTVVFEGLWCLSDREGRLEDRPAKIHFDINPGRAFETTEKSLAWLVENDFIARYEVGGVRCIWVKTFNEHQNPHQKEPPSKLPSHPSDTGQAPDKTGASPSPVPVKPKSGPADSGFRIPDSPFLIPDSLNPVPGAGTVPTEPDTVQKVFTHWQQTHRKPKARLDDKRRKLIRKALEHYGEADLCQSISGYLNSPHHMGQNQNGTVYDTIELFMRDSAHIDAGLKFYAEPPRTDLSPKTRAIVAATESWTPPENRHASN